MEQCLGRLGGDGVADKGYLFLRLCGDGECGVEAGNFFRQGRRLVENRKGLEKEES